MVINSTSGLITWVPSNDEVGNNTVTVRVIDSNGKYAVQSFVVEVKNVDDAPEIESVAPTTAVQNETYTYQVIATDPDLKYGDSLRYVLVNAPAGMVINSTSGLITWVPGYRDLGNHTIVIQVIDSYNLSAVQKFVISVVIGNHHPILTNEVVYLMNAENEEYTFTVTYKDEDGDSPSEVYLVLDGTKIKMDIAGGHDNRNGLIFQYTGKLSPGEHTYAFVAVDSHGASYVTDTYTIDVKAPPNYLWDYIIIGILVALAVLVGVDVYLRKKKGKGIEDIVKKSKKETAQEETI